MRLVTRLIEADGVSTRLCRPAEEIALYQLVQEHIGSFFAQVGTETGSHENGVANQEQVGVKTQTGVRHQNYEYSLQNRNTSNLPTIFSIRDLP